MEKRRDKERGEEEQFRNRLLISTIMVEKLSPTIVLENTKKTGLCYVREASGNTAIGDFLTNPDLAPTSFIGF